MKTFSELVECLACKVGVFFFTFHGLRVGVSQKRIPRERLTCQNWGGVEIKGLGIGHQSGASPYESLLSTSQECV